MRQHWRDAVVLVGLSALIVVPLLVALIVLADPRWLAMSDVAHLEMRVRDVGTGHTPLLGLGGRIEGFGEQGNHPGPLPFYALALPYRLLGGEGWSLLAATAVLGAVAAGLAIWMGHRRGGWPLALGITGILLLLFRGYRIETMVEAWTPHLAVVWWMVYLIAIWSLLCCDVSALPVAVFSGCFVLQAHVGYSLQVGALALVTMVVLVWSAVRGAEREERGLGRRWWLAGSLGLLVLLWLPPLLEQLLHEPGNMAVTVENFRTGGAERVAVGDAVRAGLGHLSVDLLLTQDLGRGIDSSGPTAMGLVLVSSWVVSVAVAWRRRVQALVRLHAVVGVAFVSGLVAMTGIYGLLLSYLMLWAWGTTALMLLATLWTFLSAGPDEPGDSDEPKAALVVSDLRWRWASPALGLATGLLSLAFVAEATTPEMPDARLVGALDAQAAATVDQLEDDPAGCGSHCRYLVTWHDPVYLASQGYGLVVELERRGLDTYASEQFEGAVPEHRVLDATDADLVIHVAVTDQVIEATRNIPGAVLVADVDPFSPGERARYEEQAEALAGDLEAAGLDDLAERLRQDGTTGEVLPLDGGVPSDLERRIDELNDVTRPSAVFLLPSGPA